MSAVAPEISNHKKDQQSASPDKDSSAAKSSDTMHSNGSSNNNNNNTKSSSPKEAASSGAKNGHLGKSMNVLRERSFIRPTNPQMMHPINAAIFMADPMHQKRRSFGHVVNYPLGPPQHHHLQNSMSASAIHHHQQQQLHLRGKPELEVYRPPSTSFFHRHTFVRNRIGQI